MTIISRSVFEEGGKIYQHVFLDDTLYELQKRLQYKKIDVSEGIDANKISVSKCWMMLDLNSNRMFVTNVTMY